MMSTHDKSDYDAPKIPMELKLGDVSLEVPFFLSPLSGYTDLPMRLLARQHGIRLAYSGMILDKSTFHGKVLERPNFVISDQEHPVGAQLLGTDPKTMAQAARNLHEYGYDLIDLNFACPAPKVVAKKRGGYLLTQPAVVMDIFRRTRDAVSCPVTMKLRIGFDHRPTSRGNFWWICEQAVAEGIDALVVHGRTVQQQYRGQADWQILAELKERFPQTTIIGSGDLFDADIIVQKLITSGLDGVALARGAIGNPWIYREIEAILQGKAKPPPPSLAEQGQVLLRHFEMVLDLYPARKAVILFRKYCVKYTKRHPQRKKVLHDLIFAQTVDQVKDAIGCWYEK